MKWESASCAFLFRRTTFYISSLSSLTDNRPKYRMIVKERVVHDNTRALIDFSQGSAAIDTCLGDNASELRRIRRCFDDVASMDGLVADSIVIVASCSLRAVMCRTVNCRKTGRRLC